MQSLVAGLLSLGLCASVAPMGALAAYDRYDVNHDGAVDINDVIYLNRYMVGAFSVKSSSALDVNQNKIIDLSDSLEILAKLVGNSTYSIFINITEGSDSVQTVPDELLAETVEDELFPSGEIAEPYVINDSRDYYKYDYAKRTCTKYTLDFSTDAQVASVDSVDGLDSINAISSSTNNNYYKVKGNGKGMDGIIRLTTSTNNIGTAFIVGDHLIATAAHCVWSKQGTTIASGFCNDLQVKTCDKNGVVTSKKCTVKEIHIPKSYADKIVSGERTPNTIDRSIDYALITVSEDLSEYTHFNLGVPSTDYINDMGEVPIFLSGFPNDVSSPNQVLTSFGHEYKGENRISDEQHLYVDNRDWYGMSGGPIYTVTDVYENITLRERTYIALSINSLFNVDPVTGKCAYGGGAAMNSHMLAFYKKNSNIGY